MTIVVLSLGSPRSRKSWSGIPFYALRELNHRFGERIHVIDTPLLDQLVLKSRRLTLGRIDAPREPLVSDAFDLLLRRRLEKLQPDLIVSLGAGCKVARVAERWPVVLISDGPFDALAGYYPKYQKLGSASHRRGRRMQAELLARCRLFLASSQWAARCAAESSPEPASRFMVAPMGANLDEDPSGWPPRSNQGELNLLFVGYDWARKGGPIVLETFKILQRRFAARLHIVGCQPAEAEGLAGVVIHGRLNKDDEHDRRRLAELYRQASMFFMPSRSEAYGLAYCEACAFSLPVVAARTGGVGEIVRHQENGLLLAPESRPEVFADEITALWTDSRRYRRMQAKARQAYETRLNWAAWADAFEQAVGLSSGMAGSASSRPASAKKGAAARRRAKPAKAASRPPRAKPAACKHGPARSA